MDNFNSDSKPKTALGASVQEHSEQFFTKTSSDPVASYLKGFEDAKAALLSILIEESSTYADNVKSQYGADNPIPERHTVALQTFLHCLEVMASVKIKQLEPVADKDIN
jgi:hypothetical protein